MEAVVFDMDGVIFDTERLVLEGWAETGKKHGIEGTDAVCRQCLGTTYEVSRQIFLDHYGEDFPYETYKEEMRAYFYRAIEKEVPLKPGIREILEYLKKEGFRIGLASSTRREAVLSELDQVGLTGYFDVVIGGDLLKRSKPEPDIYLMACRELGVEPVQAYAIEDSYNGIRSAHAAGMHPIMVPDLMPPTEEMREKSVVICDNLQEAQKFIEKMRKNNEKQL